MKQFNREQDQMDRFISLVGQEVISMVKNIMVVPLMLLLVNSIQMEQKIGPNF